MPKFIEKPIADFRSYVVELKINGWTDANKFASQDRIVEKEGRKYILRAKLNYDYSLPERLGRIALGALAVFITCGAGLLSKRVINLFTESRKVQRIGVLSVTQLDNIKSIKLIFTQETSPLQYRYEFTCVDGQKLCTNIQENDREAFLQKYSSKFESSVLDLP